MAALSLPVLLAGFVLAACAVWWAGTRLPRYVVALSDKTGLGQGLAGMLVLGGITSMPEMATATTAAAIGAPLLALNDVLGSASFNILLLAMADLLLGSRPLTSVVGKPVTLIQGVLGMMVLALIIVAITVGDRLFLGIAGWYSAAIFMATLFAIRISDRSERRPMWLVVKTPDLALSVAADRSDIGWRAILTGLPLLGIVILIAGAALATTAATISDKAGLGGSLTGFLFVAAATSLPELSAITGAVRAKRYELALGEVFGSNLFNFALIFIIDLASPGPPVLELAGTFEAAAALLALLMSGVFVLGLIERRDRTILRMGEDSIAVLVVYAIGLAILLTIA